MVDYNEIGSGNDGNIASVYDGWDKTPEAIKAIDAARARIAAREAKWLASGKPPLN